VGAGGGDNKHRVPTNRERGHGYVKEETLATPKTEVIYEVYFSPHPAFSHRLLRGVAGVYVRLLRLRYPDVLFGLTNGG
jgi:hypothetical protein